MKFFLMLLAVFVITGCDYDEVKREIGYKGRARVNPWLAAERFCEQYDGEVRSLATWTAPQYDDAVWFVPASIPSNASYIRQLEEWVDEGGHLVLLVEHADAESSDWSHHVMPPDLEPACLEMLDRAGIELKPAEPGRGEVVAEKIRFQKESYEVDARSNASVARKGGKQGVFASVRNGEGRLTVLTDARIFRNRWIGDKDHAALLDALISATEYDGNIGFLRGAGLSLWGLLRDHLWPVLVGLVLLTVLWLWKNFSRFGPIEPADAGSPLRGYEHHLEALGDFQWRLDRAAALLVPLREQIVERGQRIRARAGRRDDDFLQFLAERAGISRERVHRALAEAAPVDSGILTRTTADLQRLLQVLH